MVTIQLFLWLFLTQDMKKIVLTIWIVTYAVALFAAGVSRPSFVQGKPDTDFSKKVFHATAAQLHHAPKQYSLTSFLPSKWKFVVCRQEYAMVAAPVKATRFIQPVPFYLLHSVYRI